MAGSGGPRANRPPPPPGAARANPGIGKKTPEPPGAAPFREDPRAARRFKPFRKNRPRPNQNPNSEAAKTRTTSTGSDPGCQTLFSCGRDFFCGRRKGGPGRSFYMEGNPRPPAGAASPRPGNRRPRRRNGLGRRREGRRGAPGRGVAGRRGKPCRHANNCGTWAFCLRKRAGTFMDGTTDKAPAATGAIPNRLPPLPKKNRPARPEISRPTGRNSEGKTLQNGIRENGGTAESKYYIPSWSSEK